jgi:hypothetical protein
MKRSLRRSLSVLFLISLTVGPVAAQQNVSVANLREQISQLQQAVQSGDTPPSVRAANVRLLAEKRIKLRTSLEMQLGALRRYQESYQSRFSVKEKQSVLDSIRSIEAELQDLRSAHTQESSVARSQQERGHAKSPQRNSPAGVGLPPASTRGLMSNGGDTGVLKQPRENGSTYLSRQFESPSVETQRARSIASSNVSPTLSGAALRPVALAGADAVIPPPPTTAGAIPIYWGTARGAAPCPTKVTERTTVTFRLIDINDLFIDFDDGSRMVYQLTVERYPISRVPPENPFGVQSGRNLSCNITAANLPAILDYIRSEASRDPRISRRSPGGVSVSLNETAQAARNIQGVECILDRLARNNQDPVFDGVKTNPVFQWIKRIEGEHVVEIPVVLEPDYNYDFKFEEMWKGRPTQGGTIKASCGENDLFTLSLGPVISTLPSRTYSHQKAPVPAGSSTTKDILSVGNNRNINVLGAALLNYHLPRISWLPREMGLALSAGPVYTLGSTPGVSALGLFVGPTIHVNRSIFLTPGLHIGQFADFPEGFVPGSIIPDQFGDLHPVARTTAHFAFGLTYRTASFKKAGGDGGGAADPGTSPPGGKNDKNETSGNPGTGTPPPANSKPTPQP